MSKISQFLGFEKLCILVIGTVLKNLVLGHAFMKARWIWVTGEGHLLEIWMCWEFINFLHGSIYVVACLHTHTHTHTYILVISHLSSSCLIGSYSWEGKKATFHEFHKSTFPYELWTFLFLCGNLMLTVMDPEDKFMSEHYLHLHLKLKGIKFGGFSGVLMSWSSQCICSELLLHCCKWLVDCLLISINFEVDLWSERSFQSGSYSCSYSYSYYSYSSCSYSYSYSCYYSYSCSYS